MVPTRIKVCLTSGSLPHEVGGKTTHTSLLLKSLSREEMLAGVQYPIVPPAWTRALDRGLDMLRNRSHAAEVWRRRIVQWRKGFDCVGANILHCHDAVSALALAPQARRMGMKVVCTLHGPMSGHHLEATGGRDERTFRDLWDMEKEAWEHVDAFIAVDTGQARILEQQGVPASKITVLFNAVDIDYIDCQKPPEFGESGSEDRRILIARRLAPKTGVKYAISALALVRSDVRYLVAGDGLERKRLHKMAKSLGVSDRITWLGALPNNKVVELTWRSLACLVPSVPCYNVVEATSISAIEAMACGKVVIASNIGGLSEILVDGTTGILVPPGNAKALARAIDEVGGNAQLRRQIGRRAREYVREHLSSERWFSRHKALYECLLH